MNLPKINRALYLSACCFILLSGLLFVYFRHAVFTGDFYVQLPANGSLYSNISFDAITPAGRTQPFNRINNSVFNLSGFYTQFSMIVPENIIFDEADTLTITANERVYVFTMGEVKRSLRSVSKGQGVVYDMPHTFLPNTHLPAKLNALFIYTRFALAALILFVLFVLFSLVMALMYLRFKEHLLRLSHVFYGRKQWVILPLLALVYLIVFLKSASFTAFVPLSGDSWEYQVMGVNLAKGHGIQRLSLLEPYETYAFDDTQIDTESQYNLNISPYYVRDTYRTPAYPVFMALVYSVTGINPYALKAVQLLLLCLVAAFMPLLMRYWWGIKGYFTGLASGLIFITMYYPVAGTVMTEPLLIFIAFLLVLCVTVLLKNPSRTLFAITGVLLAVSLLIKGMLAFLVIMLFVMAVYFYAKRHSLFTRSRLRIALFAFVLTLLPWSMYASYINHFMLVEPISKKQISAATDSVAMLLEQNTIDSTTILTITDSVSGLYYRNRYWEASRYFFVKDFIAHHPDVLIKTYPLVIDFVKTEINKFYLKHLEYIMLPYFNDQYLYINTKGLTLLSIQPSTLLLESNNEHCIDGGWHQEARHDTYYYKTDNAQHPAFFRVLVFYLKHPNLFLSIVQAKIYAGFRHFIFVQMLLVFMVLHIWWPYRRKLWHVLLFLGLSAAMVLFVRLFAPVLPLLMAVAVLSVVYARYRHIPIMPFAVPGIVWLMLLNTLLITLVFYGLDRFTLITEFLVIPIVLYFVAHLFILPQNHKNTEVQQNLSR